MCIKNSIMIFSLFFGLCSNLYAFENIETHPELTQRAINASTCELDSYLKAELGLEGGLSTELYWDFPSSIKDRMGKAEPDITTRSVLNWIKAGSIIEDERKTDLRFNNHFHDPTRNSGLDNTEANYWASGRFTGDSAKDWAINHSSNEFDWQSARSDFYSALTANSQSDREEYLASAFLRLGHVLHMLEDMGVPSHARNDSLFAHVRSLMFDKNEPLETWIEKMIIINGSLNRWISGGWTPTPQVYSKVSNYFDADVYTGNYLGDGVPTPSTWGLSERTNYQFLSWTTIFEDDFLTSLYWFPNPAKINTTEVNESGRIYLAGYGVEHLARQTMSQHHLQHNRLNRAWCVLGEAIYDDYAEITIPRTIDYTTGLVNYFFRGKLSATAECVECNIVELTITNQSVNSVIHQTLKGGAFELYWDNEAGNRTEITDFVIDGGWTSSSTLAYNGHIIATFIKPTGANPVKYVVVYKGNICESSVDTDSDDENAIATTIVTAPVNCCNRSICPSGGTICEGNPCWPSGYLPDYLLVRFTGVRRCCDDSLIEELNTCHCLSIGGFNESCEEGFWKKEILDVNLCGTYYHMWIGVGDSPFGNTNIEVHLEGGSSEKLLFMNSAESDFVFPCPPKGYANGIAKTGTWPYCFCIYGTNPVGYGGYITLIDETNILPTPNWINNHFYEIGNTVMGTDGKIYVCKLAHTSNNNQPIIGIDWEDYWELINCSM